MASRQSVSSILKPPKVRAPLKEIEPVDPDSDENTASLPKRKVSFSGMNKIKMYNTGATSLTVNQAPMFDEHLSMLSDSSNAEKTKLSGKFEKSDTNCTVENNARVIIEYESPNDNMEMTEALSGKILSDTINTIDNNGSKHFDYNSDYSECNMEFTEAIKVGQILNTDFESDVSSTCMSETLMDEQSSEDLMTQSTSRPASLPNTLEENLSNTYSSNMDFTCANKKSNIMDLSYSNTQSSNMELTCITNKSLKYWSNDDSKLFNKDLTELSDRQTLKGNFDLEYDYECSQNSIVMELEVSHENIVNDNCESENVQSILYTKNSEINNSNQPNCVTVSKNDKDVFEKLSSSVVSMDIDPTLEENEYDIIYLNGNNSESAVNEQNNSIIPITEVENKLDNFLNVIDLNYQNNSKIFMSPTGSSFVQDISPEKKLLEPVSVELLKESFHAHTSVLDQTKYIEDKIIIVEEIKEKKYSRKTMKIMPSMTQESVPKSYSRKSIIPASTVNQTQASENEDLSNTSTTARENKYYSRKLIEPISVFGPTNSSESECVEDASAIDTNYEQIRCSRKSILPLPTSNLNQTTFCENKDLSNKSTTVKENETDSYSIKLVESISDFDLTNSFENIGDSTAVVEEIKKKSYSRKTIGPSLLAQNEFSGDSICNDSLMSEASMAPLNINNKSTVSNNSNIQQLDKSNHEDIMTPKIEQKSILLNENEDDFKSPFRKKSKKSMILTHLTKQPTEHLYVEHENNKINDNKSKLEIDSNLDNFDCVSEMDESVEIESKNCTKTNISSEKINLTLSLPFLLNNISHIEKVSNSSVNKDESILKLPDQNVNKLPTDTNLLHEEINNKSLKMTDFDEINNVKHSIDMITNSTCVESIANMSISDDIHDNNEQPFTGNRKRSYSNRDYNIPLSCSTFICNPNDNNSLSEDFSKENSIEKKSPIKRDIIKENIINNDESIKENCIKVNQVEDKFDEEILSNEVMEFLARWSNQFVECKLTIHKCTNRVWIFNVLDGNIVLMITYFPIFNDNSFLKVEDISFTSKTITPNEILKFGINWILKKYNPRFFKQICFTSRDVELLLTSLLDDIHFVSKAMKNMSYVRDIHCVTFKDSKAQFILHNMDCLMMVRIEILLSNIHKLSVKDISVDCLFGFFNSKLLDEIIENVTKDCNILQSLIEKLKKICTDEMIN